MYYRVATMPSAENTIIGLSPDTTTWTARITIDNGGVLRLYDEDGQITGTTTLSVDTWYSIELQFDKSPSAGSHVVSARVDGTQFAGASDRNLSTGVHVLFVGGNLSAEAQTTGNWYFDDIAINDSTGSFQNSWPGEGSLVHLRPNAAGDNTQWINAYTEIDEVTPNDGADIIRSNTTNQITDVNVDATPAAIGASDTINAVAVGFRFHGESSSANPTAVVRIKASSGGTVEESSTITPVSTTWFTNALTYPRNYGFTLYDLPGGSTTAWTKSTLDTAQIGARITSGNTNNFDFSTMWLLVDYAPAGAAALSVSPSESSSVAESANLAVAHQAHREPGIGNIQGVKIWP
jgi:hypothetical protein